MVNEYARSHTYIHTVCNSKCQEAWPLSPFPSLSLSPHPRGQKTLSRWIGKNRSNSRIQHLLTGFRVLLAEISGLRRVRKDSPLCGDAPSPNNGQLSLRVFFLPLSPLCYSLLLYLLHYRSLSVNCSYIMLYPTLAGEPCSRIAFFPFSALPFSFCRTLSVGQTLAQVT